MSRDLLAAAEDMFEAATDLSQAIHDDDPESMASAIERRTDCYARLAEMLPEDPPEEVSAVFQRIRTVDRKALEAAEAARDETRSELEAIARIRCAIRTMRPDIGPPRFIERRV